MMKKSDSSDFEHGMVVCGRRAALTQTLLIFHTKPSLGFTENGLKNRKYPVIRSFVGDIALLMAGTKGHGSHLFKLIKRQQ